MDLLGLGALGLVTAEWLALGALSGIDWPGGPSPFWAPRWALWLLVGAVLLAATQLVLALIGVGFGTIPVVLVSAALVAFAIRRLSPPQPCAVEPPPMPAQPRQSVATANEPRQIPPDEPPPLAPEPTKEPRQVPANEPPPTRAKGTNERSQIPTSEPPPMRAKGTNERSQIPGSDPPPIATKGTMGPRPMAANESPPMSANERAGWLLLGAVLLAATVRSLLLPEAGWDAFSHWGLRAQAFAIAQTVVDAHSEHEYYPPLVPLLEAWLYLHRGMVSIDLGKTIWAVLGSAFAVCLSWHLRLSLRQPWLAPWFGTAIVVTATALLESFWTGQADLALTAFLTLATLAVFQTQGAGSRRWLLQAGIFAAAAALTKFEGFPRIAVVVAALVLEGLLARRWTSPLKNPNVLIGAAVLLGSAVTAVLVWGMVELTHGISANAEHLGPPQLLAMSGLLASLVATLGGVRTGGGILVAVLAWLVAGRQLFSSPLRLVSLVVLGQVAATMLAFLLSETGPDVAVRTSATRLFEHVVPLALFAAAVGLPAASRLSGWRGG
jgi:hypothetical protein